MSMTEWYLLEITDRLLERNITSDFHKYS